MTNLKILNKINTLQLDKNVDGLDKNVERLNGIQKMTDGHSADHGMNIHSLTDGQHPSGP